MLRRSRHPSRNTADGSFGDHSLAKIHEVGQGHSDSSDPPSAASDVDDGGGGGGDDVDDDDDDDVDVLSVASISEQEALEALHARDAEVEGHLQADPLMKDRRRRCVACDDVVVLCVWVVCSLARCPSVCVSVRPYSGAPVHNVRVSDV